MVSSKAGKYSRRILKLRAFQIYHITVSSFPPHPSKFRNIIDKSHICNLFPFMPCCGSEALSPDLLKRLKKHTFPSSPLSCPRYMLRFTRGNYKRIRMDARYGDFFELPRSLTATNPSPKLTMRLNTSILSHIKNWKISSCTSQSTSAQLPVPIIQYGRSW